MSPQEQLLQILSPITWNVNWSDKDNIDLFLEIYSGSPSRIQERWHSQFLREPIRGLRRIKIYYPIDGHLHPVDYVTQHDIIPVEILQGISEFYRLPWSRANADRLAQFTGRPHTNQALPGTRIVDVLEHRGFFKELVPYQDGYAVIFH